jgi:hypothetical protein
LLVRSGIRMFVLTSGTIGAFAVVQIATGVPFTIALVAWSVWYATRAFERSTEWDDPDPTWQVARTTGPHRTHAHREV